MKSRKVLIIDDESDICFLFNHFLNSENHKGDYALSLAEGFIKLNEMNPDLLFLDISLPDGCGLKAIKQIKKSYPDLKIVIISAFDSDDDRIKAKKAGADSFIPKPFSRITVSETIQSLFT